LLSGYAPDSTPGAFGITTASFTEPVGTAFNVYLELDAASSASVAAFDVNGSSASGSASTVFDPVGCYPASGPVFNLPAGYTVTSTEGGIVNNVGTATGCASSNPSIPEPGSLVLLVSAVLGLAGSGRLLRRGH
jgi:hypothetical protein